ncbi:MAG TPA: hypothetical protein VF265_05415 [Nevskiaceae bacterium]
MRAEVPPVAPPRWKQVHERSSPAMLATIVWIALHLGRGVARALLVPIVLYFQLTGAGVRRSARYFLSAALGRPARSGEVFRNLYVFAACMLDRVFLLSGRSDQIRIQRHADPDVLEQLAAGSALMVTAHLGSAEVLRAFGAHRHQLRLRLVMDRRHGAMTTRVMQGLDPSLGHAIIDSRGGPAVALAIQQALDDGEVVGLMADRTTLQDPGLPIPFLGRSARLPCAPWRWAAALGVPVVLCFGLYRGGRCYDLYLETFSNRRAPIARAQRAAYVADCVARYGARLEHYARLAPFNWFNFYDFWADAAAGN